MAGRGKRAVDGRFRSPMLARTPHRGTFGADVAAGDGGEIDALLLGTETGMERLVGPADGGLVDAADAAVAEILPLRLCNKFNYLNISNFS